MLPVVLSVAFSALIPLMTVVNYSVQDILGPDQRVLRRNGVVQGDRAARSRAARRRLLRQLTFSIAVLLIEVPLGVALALAMPVERLALLAHRLVIFAMPLLVPWNVVGTIWQIFGRADIGLLGVRAWPSWVSTTTMRKVPRTRG